MPLDQTPFNSSCPRDFRYYQSWGFTGIEPMTSRTRITNHATRPKALGCIFECSRNAELHSVVGCSSTGTARMPELGPNKAQPKSNFLLLHSMIPNNPKPFMIHFYYTLGPPVDTQACAELACRRSSQPRLSSFPSTDQLPAELAGVPHVITTTRHYRYLCRHFEVVPAINNCRCGA